MLHFMGFWIKYASDTVKSFKISFQEYTPNDPKLVTAQADIFFHSINKRKFDYLFFSNYNLFNTTDETPSHLTREF